MGRKALGKSYKEIEAMNQTGFNFGSKKTNDQRVIEALQRGEKITPLDSWQKMGCYRLSAVIFRLRQGEGHSVDGVHDIKTGRVEVANQFGDKITVACYSLVVA